MIVKISKKMLSELKKDPAFKNAGIDLSFYEMPRRAYELYTTGYTWENEIDYDPARETFKTIRVSYAPELYALPRFLTTADLLRVFHHSGKTWAGFKSELLKEIEI